MPNKRGPGQKLLNFQASNSFETEINSAVKAAGYKDRSDYVRAAIREKMARDGIIISDSIVQPPSRAGKGGRSKYPDHKPDTIITPDDTINSSSLSRANSAAPGALREALNLNPKSKPSQKADEPISYKSTLKPGTGKKSKKLPGSQDQAPE